MGATTSPLVIGTSNRGKIAEYEALFQGTPITLIQPDADATQPVIEEVESTEQDNAMAKACAYANAFQLPALADDSGMYIIGLGDKPGIMVRRWGGVLPDDISDQDWLDFFLEQIRGLSTSERKGNFLTAAAIATPDGRCRSTECSSAFDIVEPPRPPLDRGMPMNAVRYIPNMEKMWRDLTCDERLQLHRGQMRDDLVSLYCHLTEPTSSA
jgi:XTP/dITP diphosphohydrolase